MGEHWKVSKEPGWDQAKQAVVPDAIDVIGNDSEPQMFVCDMATPAQIQLAAAAPELLELLTAVHAFEWDPCSSDDSEVRSIRSRVIVLLGRLTRLGDPGDGRR